jgi:phosphotransacetylase
MADWRMRAARIGARLVLPEAEDARVLAAAVALRELAIMHPVLLGDPRVVRRGLSDVGADAGVFEVVDPREDSRARVFADDLYVRRREKGLSQGEARLLCSAPLNFGAAMVASGQAEAMVAGAAHPTGEVIRAGLHHVGLAPGVKVVSGAFLMLPPDEDRNPLLFADAAVIPEPDLDELVAIGLASARTFASLIEREATIACLSFSTLGSASHPSAARMARLAERLREEGLRAEGELQFDAAIVPAVAAKKAPGRELAGRADVLLFPGLDAANIGYKIAQRLGNWQAIGPLVQGLAKPVFDLSRGCSALDVVNTASLAVLQARGGAGDGS